MNVSLPIVIPHLSQLEFDFGVDAYQPFQQNVFYWKQKLFYPNDWWIWDTYWNWQLCMYLLTNTDYETDIKTKTMKS